METADVTGVLEDAHRCIRSLRRPEGRLRTGVDLGTATCVITVVDDDGRPVWIDFDRTAAVRDGVVVDFSAAVTAVRELKRRAEEALCVELHTAATAFPPCIGEADSRACRFVLEGSGFEDVVLVDEVSAANKTLGIENGVVVDVGGGSTGVGVFRDGGLVALDDRAGGGHHLDLVLAGALGVDLTEAEERKRSGGDDSLAILRPGIERIASSIRDLTTNAEELDIHLAGGALMLDGADTVISKYLGRTVHSYPHSLLITPLGIARYAS